MRKSIVVLASLTALTVTGCGQKPDTAPAASASEEATAAPTETIGNHAQMKPGLWEMNTEVMGMKVSGLKVCVDEKMAKDGRWDKTEMDPKDCEKFDLKRRADGGDIDMVCTSEGQTVSGKISYKVTGGTAFHQTMDVTLMNGPKMQSTTEGKWISECPAGLKAGDVLSDGAKMDSIPR